MQTALFGPVHFFKVGTLWVWLCIISFCNTPQYRVPHGFSLFRRVIICQSATLIQSPGNWKKWQGSETFLFINWNTENLPKSNFAKLWNLPTFSLHAGLLPLAIEQPEAPPLSQCFSHSTPCCQRQGRGKPSCVVLTRQKLVPSSLPHAIRAINGRAKCWLSHWLL